MKTLLAVLGMAALPMLSVTAWAQGNGQVKRPQVVGNKFMVGAKLQFARSNKMTPDGNAASKQQRVRSVPNFQGSFMFQGQTFPYTMVGKDPNHGGTSKVDTSFVSLSFLFEEFIDQNGNNIVIDAAPVIPLLKNSPSFEEASYANGTTQFSDAIQRAEFFGVAGGNWHTVIEQPRMLTPVQIVVPFGQSQVFVDGQGTFFAAISFDFFLSQLNTIAQLEPALVNELEITLGRNVLFTDFFGGCCILGFHTAFETAVQGNTHFVQTFAFASWVDADVAAAVFGDPTLSDVLTLSHEITEWMNDPFVNNVVPPWEFPDGSACGGNLLETGDPIEALANAAFPLTLNGFTFHPQNEALLQWFEQTQPSSAFQGAFSFPNTTLLTGPATPCH
jgi:chitinase